MEVSPPRFRPCGELFFSPYTIPLSENPVTQPEALALTLALELPVVLGLGRLLSRPDAPSWGRLLLAGLAASMLTHPLAWLANEQLAGALAFPPRAALIEIAVAAVEAAVLGWAVPLRAGIAAVVAVAANGASFGLGLLILG